MLNRCPVLALIGTEIPRKSTSVTSSILPSELSTVSQQRPSVDGPSSAGQECRLSDFYSYGMRMSINESHFQSYIALSLIHSVLLNRNISSESSWTLSSPSTKAFRSLARCTETRLMPFSYCGRFEIPVQRFRSHCRLQRITSLGGRSQGDMLYQMPTCALENPFQPVPAHEISPSRSFVKQDGTASSA